MVVFGLVGAQMGWVLRPFIGNPNQPFQWLLQGYYQPLVARSPKHRWLMWTWLGVYALVGVQMDHALSTYTVTPSGASFSGATSSMIRPIGLTGLAARGCSPSEAGVGPKKRQNALPGGQ